MKRVLFFGSEGYIGSHLVSYLTLKKYLVYGFDIHTETKSNKIKSYKQIDVSNKLEIDSISLDVDYIYYFSGITGTNLSIDDYDKFIDVNEKGLLNLLTSIREQKVYPRVIFPSTRLVYKGTENQPLPEDASKEFKTIYALNKFHNENVLKMFNKYYNIPFTIFRICVPYGNMLSDNYSYGTIGFFLNQAKNNEPITLFGSGNLKRTFTFIGDICSQIVNVSEVSSSNCEVYNIGGETYSLYEVANMVAKKFKVDVQHVEWPTLVLAQESGDTIFDSSKIENLYCCKYSSLISWINKI